MSFGLADIPGIELRVGAGGIKAPGRDDVVVIRTAGIAAAVTTRSTAASAPCVWTRRHAPGPCAAVVVNAGNANAATGPDGARDAETMASAVATWRGAAATEVLVCSTGVIGVPLPMARVLGGIRDATRAGVATTERAARAIMTTDRVPKMASRKLGHIPVAGIAKGSGMIHPNMGTMLAFVATDAAVSAPVLQALTERVAERTFNAVSVDGDTSTSDTLIVLATGLGPDITEGSPDLGTLDAGLTAVCTDLARAIARDGEGATTLITVVFSGLETDKEARAAAKAVVGSPLVKTAIAGRDANWGRIVGALGAARVPALNALTLHIAGVPVLASGRPLPFDESLATAALSQPEVVIEATVPGPGRGVAWGCDLTAEYIRINADYRS